MLDHKEGAASSSLLLAHTMRYCHQRTDAEGKQIWQRGIQVYASIDNSYRCIKTIERNWGQPAFFSLNKTLMSQLHACREGGSLVKWRLASVLGSAQMPGQSVTFQNLPAERVIPASTDVSGSLSDNEAQDIAGSCFEVRSDSSF